MNMNRQRTDEEIHRLCGVITSCGPQRLQQVLDSVDYVVKNSIEGVLVEIGVWRAGLCAAMAYKLMQLGVERDIYLVDTFSGMTLPSNVDVDLNGGPAINDYNSIPNWCGVPLEEVKTNMEATGYPTEKIHYMVGDVLDTKLEDIPAQIAILRLDTDWYASTKFELKYFEPRVSKGGVVIIDDYGHWQGSRKATDEHIARKRSEGVNIELIKIDYTGVFYYKTGERSPVNTLIQKEY